jgi:hypothetical protein
MFANWSAAERRAADLIGRLGDSLDLYLRFYQCDNETEGKDPACFTWFIDFVSSTNNVP